MGEISATNVQLEVDGTDCSRLLLENYGKRIAKFRQAEGWADLTYLISDENGECLSFKIFRDSYTNDIHEIEAEIAVMKYMAANGIQVPLVVPTKSGKFYGEAEFFNKKRGKHKNHFRLQTFIEGFLLDGNYSEDLSRQLGILVGRVDLCLVNFSHPFYENLYESEIQQSFCGHIREHMPLLTNDAHRKLSETFLKLYEERVAARLHELPVQLIHYDLHGRNVIISSDKTEIVGLIDFTDTMKTVRINEIAVALTGILLQSNGSQKVLKNAAAFLRSYESLIPLTNFEKEVLPIAIIARLIRVKTLLNFIKINQPDQFSTAADDIHALGWDIVEQLLLCHDSELARFFDYLAKE